MGDVILTGPQKATWDALVEEHLAVQQIMVEAERLGEPSGAAYERLALAWAAASHLLVENTRAATDKALSPKEDE